MTPSIAHAEISLLCSFGGKAPTLITVNEEAKKVEGGESLFDKKVLKISDRAIWLIKEMDEANAPPDLTITVIPRSPHAGTMKTVVISDTGSINNNAYPNGLCWQQNAK